MTDTEHLLEDHEGEIDAPVAETETEIAETVESEGQPRDEQGKFVSLDGEEGVEGDPAAAPDTEQPADPNAPPAPETPKAETPKEDDGEEWGVFALEQNFKVPGARRLTDGSLRVTPQGERYLHQTLGRAIVSQHRSRLLEQERSTFAQEKAAAEASVKVLEEMWDKLKAATSTEEFVELAAGFFLEREVIDQKRELAREKAKLVRPDPAPVSPEEYRDSVERDLSAELGNLIEQARNEAFAKGLTAEDWKEIAQELYAVRGAFIVQKPDGHYFSGPQAAAVLKRHAERLNRERSKLTAAAKQAEAAGRKNASAKAGVVTAPPGVARSAPAARPAAGSRAPATTATKTREQERAEWEREMGVL